MFTFYLFDIWMGDPCDLIDLKTGKPVVSYLWMTGNTIRRILANSRICSITCITQISLVPFSFFRSVLPILPETYYQ